MTRRRAALDHLLLAGPDLDAATAALEARTGVRAVPAGSHDELGACSAIARLGDHTFLEVVGPDPAHAHGVFAKRLEHLEGPQLLMWAAHTENADGIVARATEAGYHAVLTESRRTRPDGGVVSWRSVFVNGHGAGALVPFFVEWRPGEHPSREAPAGLSLVSFRIEGPQAEALKVVLDALDVSVTVRHGSEERLVAELATPKGPLTLASIATS
jgi:hypothetical protein